MWFVETYDAVRYALARVATLEVILATIPNYTIVCVMNRLQNFTEFDLLFVGS